MPAARELRLPPIGAGPLSIEQLEEGLRLLGRGDVDQNAFWDENVEAFRQTVLFAIRETSDALLSPGIPRRWSAELETQLETLIQYIELADRYIARRFLNREAADLALQALPSRLH